jgi:hypothetical protein
MYINLLVFICAHREIKRIGAKIKISKSSLDLLIAKAFLNSLEFGKNKKILLAASWLYFIYH